MCAKATPPPPPQAPPAPATARDERIEGNRRRQAAGAGSYQDTLVSGMGGDQTDIGGNLTKPVLGG